MPKKVPSLGSVHATACILRDIITIILALAFTGAIVAFLTSNGSSPVDLNTITLTRMLSFICVLSTIVRFYHGNVNYLNMTYSVSDAEAQIRHYRGKLATDFVFFFAQAIVFSALALYQSKTWEFYSLFVCLLLIDAAWCLVNVWSSGLTFRHFEGVRAQQHLSSQMNWMLANTATAGLIVVPLLLHWGDAPSEMEPHVPYFFAIIMINAVVDYWRNRRLYFPVGSIPRLQKVAFVGARFTSALSQTGFDADLRQLLQAAHEVARRSLTVRSAHEEERFGQSLTKPEEFARRDLEQVAEADIFIAVWDKATSPGLLIELGWASALQKDIVILLPADYDTMQNPMLKGLPEISSCTVVRYDGSVPSLAEGLQNALETILK